MSSTLEILLAIALIVAVTLALVLQRRLNEHRKGGGGGGGGGGGPKPRPPHPRELVNVHVEHHEGALRIRVDPWEVDVTNGKPLRWAFHADAGATMRIVPKGDWPFPGLPSQVPVQAGGSVNAGVVKGTVGTGHAYSVLVEVDGQKLDIDPDIWICF
jgi:hypothetical protein